MRCPVFITWWCVAPCRRCPRCRGTTSWPDGRGSDTRAPTEATSAGLSARRTTVPADTPPPGARSRGHLLRPSKISGRYTAAVPLLPFGTCGHSLPPCLWSAAPRGCICSECCPKPGPSSRRWIRCRPTLRCCPATENRGKG